MKNSGNTAARRYGKALFELCEESGKHSEAVLTGLLNAVEQNTELQEFLASPVTPPQAKANALLSLVGSKAPKEVQNFLNVIALKRRANVLAEILRSYFDLLRASKGEVVAFVESASALTAAQKKQIEEFVKKTVKDAKSVQVEEAQNPELLAGVKVRVGSTEFDGSVKGRFEALANQFKNV